MGKKNNNCNTIGIVLPYLKSRGTEQQSLKLAGGFEKEGFKVIIFVVQGWGSDFMYHEFEKAGVRVVNVGSPKEVGKKRVNLLRIFNLAKLARRFKCDVLVSRAGMTNQICGFSSVISFIPSIVVFSGSVKKPNKKKTSYFLEKLKVLSFLLNCGFANKAVTVSSAGAKNLKQMYPELKNRIISIQNGIDASLIRKKAEKEITEQKVLNKKRFRLCYFGSIDIKRKGLDVLFETLEFLVFEEQKRQLELLIIGSGDDEEKLKKIIKQKKLEQFVQFIGEQENPYPVVATADLFVLPSRREGLPNALLEAMALGVCCVASDCETGPNEIIENGYDGILFPSEKSDTLAKKINNIMGDENFRKKIARRGRKKVFEKFNQEKMISRYINLLETLIKNEK